LALVVIAALILVVLLLVVVWSSVGLALEGDVSLIIDDAAPLGDSVDVGSELVELSSVDLGWILLLGLVHPGAHLGFEMRPEVLGSLEIDISWHHVDFSSG
jgi:hypothetical protein